LYSISKIQLGSFCLKKKCCKETNREKLTSDLDSLPSITLWSSFSKKKFHK